MLRAGIQGIPVGHLINLSCLSIHLIRFQVQELQDSEERWSVSNSRMHSIASSPRSINSDHHTITTRESGTIQAVHLVRLHRKGKKTTY